MSVELTQRIIHVKDNGTYDSLDIFRGAPGEKGDKGDTGRGLIPGGSTGQVLKKKSGTDYDTEWANDASAVTDVQVNGTSVVSSGVANVPVMSSSVLGIAKQGIGLYINSSNALCVDSAMEAGLKAGTALNQMVVPGRQHIATFYGLAKAAGDSTQSASDNAVGTYTEGAKTAIKSMLGIDAGMQEIIISGQDPVITGIANARYNCGEVYTISITPPASGIVDVVFTSGSTAALLTLPVTVKMPVWFDATALETNTIYEITITDGVYGMVMSWPQ